jgi:hypothetical protein
MVAHCEVKPGIRSAAGKLDMTEVIKLCAEYYTLRDLNRRRWARLIIGQKPGLLLVRKALKKMRAHYIQLRHTSRGTAWQSLLNYGERQG